MAYEIPGFSFPLPSGADFSQANGGKQFRFCDISSLGKVVNPAAGGSVIGVRYNRCQANEAATVVNSGIAIVEAGGVLAPGDLVATNAVGQAVKATAGQVTVGRAFETATGVGIQVAVLLTNNAATAS